MTARRNTRRGFSLVEAVLAMAVVGIALVAALEAAAASRVGRLKVAERSEALMLAQDLMTEITARAFDDPQTSSTTIGPDGAENSGDRSGFDDVDDYDGWTGDPPEEKDGTRIAGADGLVRSVTVSYVNSSTMQASISATEIKRIDVAVTTADGREAARLTSFRTSGETGSGTILILNPFGIFNQ